MDGQVYELLLAAHGNFCYRADLRAKLEAQLVCVNAEDPEDVLRHRRVCARDVLSALVRVDD